MQRRQRVRALWAALVGAIVLAAVVIPLWVTADSGQPVFTATLYSDVIRFEADGVASLRVTIYDLSENELWNSALVMGDFVDWDRANARGERLANGYYLYLAQGWDDGDRLVLNKTGRVVLLPGNQVELKAAPQPGQPSEPVAGVDEDEPVYSPMTYDKTNFYVSGELGVGTQTPAYPFEVRGIGRFYKALVGVDAIVARGNGAAGSVHAGSLMMAFQFDENYQFAIKAQSRANIMAGSGGGATELLLADGSTNNVLLVTEGGGNVGIGTTSPNEQLEITGNFRLPLTTATTGIIYSGGNRFIHHYGSANTFVGIVAGNFTMTGVGNTAAGSGALNAITTGYYNTAVGTNALNDNTTGDSNTAVGWMALANNTTGHDNTVVGDYALPNHVAGRKNTGVGQNVLPNLTSGDSNVALGHLAGQNLTSGSHNVYISNANPPASESSTIRIGDSNQTRTYIAGIHGVAIATTTPVYIDIFGQLGTVAASSQRFKTAIADIGQTSNLLYELRPVSFRYTEELDRGALIHYGLIAEEVAEVAPNLVINDEEGAPHGVRYEQLVPLLLNELQELRAGNDALLARVEALEQGVRD